MAAFDQMATEFLAQERLAVAGVSRKSENAANMIYKKLRESGRQVFALNPNAESVEGDPCFPNLQAIPGGVDGVVIVTSPAVTEEVVRDAIAAGVPRVWMHDNSFAPTSVSAAAVAACRENGIQVLAGGCPMMFFDFGHKCMKWVLGLMGRLPAGEPAGNGRR